MSNFSLFMFQSECQPQTPCVLLVKPSEKLGDEHSRTVCVLWGALGTSTFNVTAKSLRYFKPKMST